jgi:heme exporter protein A
VSDGIPVVRTDALSKQFGGLTVLRSISIALARGKSLTLFGRNGAGKTTLLKITAGLTRTYRGSVYIFGQDVSKATEDIRRRIGFVSHESLLYSDLTARENLLFYARLYRIADTTSVVDDALVRHALEAKATTPARALSRGMKQRLSLARAFLHQPEIVYLDEPFTGLDERAADVLDNVLGTFKDRGGSIVMASHNLERGWKHADQIAVLDHGRIAFESTVADSNPSEFRALYRDIISH